MWWKENAFRIVLFYRYAFIEDPVKLQNSLHDLCESKNMLGRILVSSEGVNGTLAAPCDAMENFVASMMQDKRFELVDWKYTDCEANKSIETNSEASSVNEIDKKF